jgi:hypothetical protein
MLSPLAPLPARQGFDTHAIDVRRGAPHVAFFE